MQHTHATGWGMHYVSVAKDEEARDVKNSRTEQNVIHAR